MKAFRIFLILMIVNTAAVFSQDSEVAGEENAAVPGLIFSTSSILLDLDNYQGGVGGKFLFDNMAMRTSIGCSYENGTNRLALNGSFVLEFPFFKGRVTPYWGSGIHVAYDITQSEDGDDWARQSILTGNLGGLIGAEYFIAEYISLFAEYELFLGLSSVTNAQRVNGTVTETNATNFEIATDLGNNASIGVVIYVKPVFEIEKD